MTKYLLAAATAFALMSGVAVAETTSSDSTTTTIVAPPVGTLSTSRTEHTIDSNGTRTDTKRSTYRNDAGVAEDVHTTKTIYPPVNTTTSNTSITTTTTR